MIYLIAASLFFAFSFGLIEEHLTNLDSNFVAWARMLFALLAFLPFATKRSLKAGLTERLLLIGAVQYGCTYIAYIYSFQFLEAHQVALFTIFTPLYVTFISDAYEKRFQVFYMGMALMAVAGAAVIKYSGVTVQEMLTGFILLQIANASFAFGQIEYRRLRRSFTDIMDREIFAMILLGALLVTTLATTVTGGWAGLTAFTGTQFWVLAYLGVVASGVGFFLWNMGAVKTNPGTLAVFNNLKIPVAIAVSIIVFGEETHLGRLIAGSLLMVIAIVMAERQSNHMLRMTQSQETDVAKPAS